MDRIDKACREAAKLGMSYGQYKAMLYENHGVAPETPKKKKIAPEKRKFCAICGREIMPGSRRRKYCCEECYEVSTGALSKHSLEYKNR